MAIQGNVILKRSSELLERQSGVGSCGLSLMPNVMQAAALHARDHNLATWTPPVATDVARRHCLANIIIMLNAVTELVPGKVYAVTRGIAPAMILRIGTVNERELREGNVVSESAHPFKPLLDDLLKPTINTLSMAGKSAPIFSYLVDMTQPLHFCSCPDHLHRGGARDYCKVSPIQWV